MLSETYRVRNDQKWEKSQLPDKGRGRTMRGQRWLRTPLSAYYILLPRKKADIKMKSGLFKISYELFYCEEINLLDMLSFPTLRFFSKPQLELIFT